MAKTFKALFAEAQKQDAYWTEWATNDFAAELIRRMELCGLSRSRLAQKLGVSQAYITKVLRGDENFTIRSMTKLARAIDSVVRIHLAPAKSYTVWRDVLDGGNENALPAANRTVQLTFDRRLARASDAANVSESTNAASVAAVGFGR